MTELVETNWQEVLRNAFAVPGPNVGRADGQIVGVCKFRCVGVTKTEGAHWVWDDPEAEKNRAYGAKGAGHNEQVFSYSIRLIPVMASSAENAKFWEYSPSGTFEFQTINEGVGAGFLIGREYYVPFVLAPKDITPKSPAG